MSKQTKKPDAGPIWSGFDYGYLARAMLNREAGTFDVLIDTPSTCVTGAPVTTLRFPGAITYLECTDDCSPEGTNTPTPSSIAT